MNPVLDGKSRSSGWLAIWIAVGLLIPGVAWAADGSLSGNRAQVFIVGASDDLEHKAGLIANHIRQVMRQTKGVEVLDLSKRLRAEPPAKTKALQKSAAEALGAAKAAMREMEQEKALEHAGKAKETFEKMGGYLEPFERYKQSILLLAVAHSMQGDIKEAKSHFLDLLLLDPHLKLPKTDYEGFVVELFEKVKQGLASQPQGSISIKTQPPGADLYLDGKLKGVTPESLDGLIAGGHLVLVQLPGHENWGKLVRVEPGEHEVIEVKLTPGRAGRGFLLTAERACRAVADENLRDEVLRLGETVGLDWAVLGTLKHDSHNHDLHLYLFEFSRAQVAVEDSLELEVTEYGLEEDVRRFGVQFMRRGLEALKALREQGDPLAGRSGAEGWHRDDSGQARKHRDTRAEDENRRTQPKQESADPLDEIDGTEDW